MILPSNLIVFDTNVIESSYLPSLLRGESIRDLTMLRDAEPPYTPAISVKTLYEIQGHLKSGRVRNMAEFEYPGGIEAGMKILSSLSGPPDMKGTQYSFSQIEEVFRDSGEFLQLATALLQERYHSTAAKDVDTYREFRNWCTRMRAFMRLAEQSVEREFFIIERHHVYGLSLQTANIALQAERELCMNTFVPSEDFEILSTALLTGASALVTEDVRLLHTGWSVPANYKTSFVHRCKLTEAVESGFAVRVFSLL